jgi:hypothetical protein
LKLRLAHTVIRLVIFLGAALLAPIASAAAQSGQRLQFEDYTDDFERVWQATSTLPDDQKAAAFETAFRKIIPGFYDTDRVRDFTTAEGYRALILNALQEYPVNRAGIQRVSRDFRALVGPAQEQFEAQFGPMTGYPSVLLVHSLGEFDGGTRELADGSHLMFGADMINRLYQDTPIKPFLQHELFHLLHGRIFPDCNAIYCSLWQEGLATYVAATLNPGVSDAALLLTVPAPIRPAVEAKKSEAVCAVRERLFSEKAEDYAPLFYGNKQLPGFPARMGYYIGYLVAQDIGRTRDLRQLAAMKPDDLRPLIVASLDRMANCATGERG